jgi:hypothetical protein
MGGCASSKYAADEDKVIDASAKPESRAATLLKRIKLGGGGGNKKEKAVANGNGNGHVGEAEAGVKAAEPTKAEKEEIEFIDHEADHQRKDDEDQKKEVTTYQTTVVKHTQKEGDELLTHLKEEAFRTLQNALRPQGGKSNAANAPNGAVVTTTTNASVTDTNNASSTSSSTTTGSTADGDDLLRQIQEQCVSSIGRAKHDQIYAIVQSGGELIRSDAVKTVGELQAELEKLYPNESAETDSKANSELINKVINATTGFLTAKGTEAGALLSNILANSNAGIQGVLNETEKTTVKVTRTVTEQVMSNGQLREITKVITSNEPVAPGQSLQDVIKNLQAGASTITASTATSNTNTQVSEQHEVMTSQELVDKAEQMVNQVVTTAVERVIDEDTKAAQSAAAALAINGHVDESQQNGHQVSSSSNGFHETTENVKIEEESTVTVSTTKIVLNGEAPASPAALVVNGKTNGHLDEVQAEFYKNGKQDAEESAKKIVTSSEVVGDELQPVAQEA